MTSKRKTPKTTYDLRFRGGARLLGTATEILDAWGAMAFPPLKPGSENLKIDLAKRAWVWGGDYVDPLLPDDEFLQAIGSTRLLAGFEKVEN